MSGEAQPIGLRILVVEQEKAHRRLLRAQIELQGHWGFYYDNPIGASLALLENPDRYEVLFTGHHMPQSNGVRLAEIARKISDTMPIILATACFVEEAKDEDKSGAINFFLQKPYGVLKLEEILEQAGQMIKSHQLTPKL